jgi:hypothetical protein
MPTPTRKKTTPTNKQSKAAKKVSSAKEWKGKSSSAKIELELPSGNVALVKRPGMPELMSKGAFSDSLLPMVQKAMEQAQGRRGAKAAKMDASEIMTDPKKMADAFDSFDRVLVLTVLEPKVLYHRRQTERTDEEGKPVWEDIPEEERDEETLYTDDVELDDKMFIFQYVVGGTADLATFRQQQSEGVAALSDVSDVELPTE